MMQQIKVHEQGTTFPRKKRGFVVENVKHMYVENDILNGCAQPLKL